VLFNTTRLDSFDRRVSKLHSVCCAAHSPFSPFTLSGGRPLNEKLAKQLRNRATPQMCDVARGGVPTDEIPPPTLCPTTRENPVSDEREQTRRRESPVSPGSGVLRLQLQLHNTPLHLHAPLSWRRPSIESRGGSDAEGGGRDTGGVMRQPRELCAVWRGAKTL